MSEEDRREQWKTIIVCLSGLLGMVALAWFICPLIMDKTLVIAGLPPLIFRI